MNTSKLRKIHDFCWEIPPRGAMRVPARIFGDVHLIEAMDEKVREQISNVAALPGIVEAAYAMPDAHWGYGFPIGGVAAFDPEEGGIISMGGIGYDISCGVRTLRTDLNEKQVSQRIEMLADQLFCTVPAGVGREGLLQLKEKELDEVLLEGAHWAVERGFGEGDDLEYIEMGGRWEGADPSAVSATAKQRGKNQVGTLGSGNHYLEVQVVDRIDDCQAAEVFGLFPGQVLLTIHCGSRAVGHQVGTDYLRQLAGAVKRFGISIPDRELVCAPILSPEGKKYFSAMVASDNLAMANRQVIGHLARQALKSVFPVHKAPLLYDVSHNTCMVEEYEVGGKKRKLYVHRKGATRAFGPGHPELPDAYCSIGQPVFVGGSMGTGSYILAGTEKGTKISFASTCHGAGRAMSRTQAKKKWQGKELSEDLRGRGIHIRGHSWIGLAEEAPGAYKDIQTVCDASHEAGLAHKVAFLRPIACIKG